ncbi:MAG: hypothetical protein CM15mP53_06350 [Ectothiorhodospiraceae bacterium]|nr:MAG: hypothetical protein CM15mP53_06350 [Ectothiorhodospiraceae bacterium]
MNIYKYLWFFGTKPKDSTVTLLPLVKAVMLLKILRFKRALEDGMTGHTIANLGLVVNANVKLVKGKIKPMVILVKHLLKRSLLMTTFLPANLDSLWIVKSR